MKADRPDQALSRDAEAALATLTSHGVDVEAVGRMFKRLTAVDAERRRVCIPARVSEIASSSGLPRVTVELYVNAFRRPDRRILRVSDDQEADDPRVEIARADLIQHWDRLRAWMAEEEHERDRFLELVHRARGHAAAPERIPVLEGEALRAAQSWRTDTAATDEELEAWAARYRERDDDFAVAMAYLDAGERTVEAATEAVQRRRAHRRNLQLAFLAACAILAVWVWRRQVHATQEGVSRMVARVVDHARALSRTDPTSAALLLTDETVVTALAALPEAEQVLRLLSPRDISLSVRSLGVGMSGLVVVRDSLVAVAGDDGRVRVFRQDGRGTPVMLAGTHAGGITQIVASADGARLLTASADSTAMVWRLDGATPPVLLRGHAGPVLTAHFNRAGTLLLTATSRGTARLWDVTSGEIATIPSRGQVIDADFSPDGRLVVTVSDDGAARVWDREARVELAVCRPRQKVTRARFNSTGTAIVTASRDSTARVCRLDGSRGDLVLSGHTGAVLDARFSPGDSFVATISTDSTVRLWRVDGVSPPLVLRGHRGAVTGVAFTESTLVTMSTDATVRTWRWRAVAEPPASASDSERFADVPSPNPRELVLRGHQGDVFSVDASRDGTLLVTASADGTARLWRTSGGAGRVMSHRALVHSARFNGDDSRVVTASDDSTAAIWDVQGKRLATLSASGNAAVLSAQFDVAGRHVVTSHANGAVNYWSSEGLLLRHLASHASGVPSWSADFNREGTAVVSSAWDGTVQVSWVNGERNPLVLAGHQEKVHMARFSPAGDRVASASDDGTARIWLLQHPDSAVVLRHTGPVLSVAFSADGSRLVTASRDRTVRVWSADGDSLSVFVGHLDAVWSASFSPDDRSVISTSYDGTVRLWPTSGDGAPRILSDYPALVTAAAYRPGNGLVAAASADQLVLRWLGLQRFIDVLSSATTACLVVPLRIEVLQEAAREAEARYAACERAQGRTP